MRTLALAILAFTLNALPAAAELTPGPGEILIRGTISSFDSPAGKLVINAMAVREPGRSDETQLKAQTPKQIILNSTTQVLLSTGKATSTKSLTLGAEVIVVGQNTGRGKPMPARAISVYLPGNTLVTLKPAAEPPPPPSVPRMAPGAPVASQMRIGQYSIWEDPAGFKLAYPSVWKPSAALGANPVSFQQANMVMSIRRLPVDAGSTPDARALAAISALKAKAGAKGWRVRENLTAAAGVPAQTMTLQGEFTLPDFADLLGANAGLMNQFGQSTVIVTYLVAPANTGRNQWVLEIGVGGPETAEIDAAGVMAKVLQSLSWVRPDVKQAPVLWTPTRSANIVQIENTLHQVGAAIQTYFATETDEIVPPNWEALGPYLGGASGLMKNLKEGWPQWNVGPVQLLQPGKKVSSLGDPSSVVVGRADGPGFSVSVYADGHVAKSLTK